MDKRIVGVKQTPEIFFRVNTRILAAAYLPRDAIVTTRLYQQQPLDSPLALTSLVLGGWGLAYSNYLWVSFLLIGTLRLPGCEFVAIPHVLFRKKIHRCVDSVLNSVLDDMQQKEGLSFRLLRTESAQKWILGLALLTVFVAVIWSHILGWLAENVAIGVFASVYLTYDKTLHRISIGRMDLQGLETTRG